MNRSSSERNRQKCFEQKTSTSFTLLETDFMRLILQLSCKSCIDYKAKTQTQMPIALNKCRSTQGKTLTTSVCIKFYGYGSCNRNTKPYNKSPHYAEACNMWWRVTYGQHSSEETSASRWLHSVRFNQPGNRTSTSQADSGDSKHCVHRLVCKEMRSKKYQISFKHAEKTLVVSTEMINTKFSVALSEHSKKSHYFCFKFQVFCWTLLLKLNKTFIKSVTSSIKERAT